MNLFTCKFIVISFITTIILSGCKEQNQDILTTTKISLKNVMLTETACDSFLVAVARFNKFENLISQEDGLCTVLVPSNEAFRTYLLFNSRQRIEDISIDTMEKILNHCFINDRVSFSKLTNNSFLKTLNSDVYKEGYLFQRDNTSLLLHQSSDSIPIKFITSDVICKNGNFNRTDKLILSNTTTNTSTTTEILKANNLDSLAKLISLVPRLSNLINSDSSITIFAPNNESFASYLNGISLTSLGTANLKKLGEYHFISNQLYSNQLYKNLTLTTLSNTATIKTLSIKRSGNNLTFLSSSSSVLIGGLIEKNIKSDKAIIHTISTVLIPK